MKTTTQSSKIVKPTYNGNPPDTNHEVRLSVFDKVTDSENIAVIYAFNAPNPSNIAMEMGLSKALAEYREWAGRLGKDEEGNLVILLNDQGVRFIEATIDNKLTDALPSAPTKGIQSLHPSLNVVEELVQIQLTRFTCGSLVVGFTAHHQVADGHATSNFLVAWGLATRGLAIDPSPLHARNILFRPRDPPLIQYNHHKIEYMNNRNKDTKDVTDNDINTQEIVIHKVHFSSEFINKLRTKVSARVSKPYSRFATILAHLWRVITKARDLDGHETTEIRISVDGRMRIDPKVPNEYFGNLVLWAFPRSKVRDLINRPLRYAVELIGAEVAKINNSYFKSFIDFASSDIIRKEGLISTASINKRVLSPDLEVNSWLTFPFFDLDFGSGSPNYFMPTYFGVEGMLFLLPSYLGDGSIDAIVPLFRDNIDTFNMHCHSLD
jgi:shikimate O-hydroxycinnamoyltransferase